MLKIGALVSGGGTNLQAVIDQIEKGGIHAEIAVVVSSNPNAYALERAKKHGIPAVCVRKKDHSDYEAELVRLFKENGVGLVILAGFMVVLGTGFIEAFRGKIMNIHPSLIPSFCGAGCYGLKVHEMALKKGVKVTGATVHFVNEETDGGPIILQKPVFVEDGDTPERLQQRVMKEAEWVIYPRAIQLFAEGKLTIENAHVKGAAL
ncbi:MAG: phosphoribosylglycinamide formyltransferase [Clostridiales bacterium]|jgi:phosphoribosylglycinamide formyltransferase-1|nr:phosphoribosylglycinamide formyltransferase [Clostridiales bacterium]